MNPLIHKDSLPEIIDLYLNNPTFHRIVAMAEQSGMSHEQMLEQAVVALAKLNDALTQQYISHMNVCQTILIMPE